MVKTIFIIILFVLMLWLSPGQPDGFVAFTIRYLDCGKSDIKTTRYFTEKEGFVYQNGYYSDTFSNGLVVNVNSKKLGDHYINALENTFIGFDDGSHWYTSKTKAGNTYQTNQYLKIKLWSKDRISIDFKDILEYQNCHIQISGSLESFETSKN